MEIPCIFKITGQLRNDDMFNKLLHIQNNRSMRKEQEIEEKMKRKATVEGRRNKKVK